MEYFCGLYLLHLLSHNRTSEYCGELELLDLSFFSNIHWQPQMLEIYRENVVETNIKVGKAYLALGKIFYHSKAFEVANEYL